MSNVIDFAKYVKDNNKQIESESPEVRVVVFLEYLRCTLNLMYEISKIYKGSTFCHDFRTVTIGRKKTQSQQLFVQLPDMCEHVLILHGFVPFSPEFDIDYSNKSVIMSQQYDFSNLILEHLQAKSLLDVLRVYTIEPKVELHPGQIVITTVCINPGNIITTVIDFEMETVGIKYRIQNKLFVPVEQNTSDALRQMNNMDHLFAIDLLNYCSNLLIEHCDSNLI